MLELESSDTDSTCSSSNSSSSDSSSSSSSSQSKLQQKYAGSKISFEDLEFNLFVAGELEIMSGN